MRLATRSLLGDLTRSDSSEYDPVPALPALPASQSAASVLKKSWSDRSHLEWLFAH
jgi:hypothetical protein